MKNLCHTLNKLGKIILLAGTYFNMGLFRDKSFDQVIKCDDSYKAFALQYIRMVEDADL